MNKEQIIKQLGKPKIDEMMNKDKYWSIIQNSIDNSNDQYEQEDWLIEELSELNLKEIIGFYNRTEALLDKLNNKKMKCASVIINYYTSDDSFLYFRAWIISLGKVIYNEALKNPDFLAQYVMNAESTEYFHEFETFLYVPDMVFEILTDGNIYDFIGNRENDILNAIDASWLFERTDEMITNCPILFNLYENTNYKKREEEKELLEVMAKNLLLKNISAN